jgi:protein-L-isoaspartate(D-aspartate) O-methyltransferase
MDEAAFIEARHRMVEEQLVPRGILDYRILEAMRRVPRHLFVTETFKERAYEDSALPIGEGQTISQPYMVAVMTEALCLQDGGKVLEIGTGSGYQAAVLCELGARVFSIERVEPLARRAEGILRQLGYRQAAIRVSDGSLGWEEEAPFDGIIVTASAPRIPASLVDQLAVGGRLVIPVGSRYSQILMGGIKTPSGLESTEIVACVFVPLLGREGWESFDEGL